MNLPIKMPDIHPIQKILLFKKKVKRALVKAILSEDGEWGGAKIAELLDENDKLKRKLELFEDWAKRYKEVAGAI